jgi:hypothetical protein
MTAITKARQPIRKQVRWSQSLFPHYIDTDKGMIRSDRSKPALIFFFPLQEYTQQNPLSKF